MPYHLREKPFMRNVPSYASYSPDLIIKLVSYFSPLTCLFKTLELSQFVTFNKNTDVTLQPICASKKLAKNSVVYKLACDLCSANYVSNSARHLHQRIPEHKYSAIGKHLLDVHDDNCHGIEI